MSPQKIPCSVALITSKGEGLGPVLESLRDFAEVIVCHGGAPEEALATARSYGAKLIKQYDTDEANLSCVMDKAFVRERAMSASSCPWRFFMDRDDRLSKEAIDEIRAITTNPHPSHLIWRMPTIVFIDGHKILYEASHPSYQTRLVHESVGAHFKGPVHDHLVFDAEKFPPGTMKSHYDFHWSKERVAHYWKYLSTYAERELQTSPWHRSDLPRFLYWGVYRRLRIIAGYLLWRLPRMYLLHGFRDSMPLSIEMQIVAQHGVILFGSIGHFISTRRSLVYARRLLAGDSRASIARDLVLRDCEAYGRVLDVDGGSSQSYWSYLQTHRWHRVTSVEGERLGEQPSDHFDTVLILNDTAHDPKKLFAEAFRCVRKGGALIGVGDSDVKSILDGAAVEVLDDEVSAFRARKSRS